jgi:hypothetical protein
MAYKLVRNLKTLMRSGVHFLPFVILICFHSLLSAFPYLHYFISQLVYPIRSSDVNRMKVPWRIVRLSLLRSS